MIAALILLLAITVTGVALYAEHRLHLRRTASRTDSAAREQQPSGSSEPDKDGSGNGEECCGMHISCERDSLLASVSEQIEYYDDDELDRHAGKDPSQYTDAEIEEFREVLLTLRPDDIAGWARSIQLRGITLPPAVRDELIMIVAEERSARSSHA